MNDTTKQAAEIKALVERAKALAEAATPGEWVIETPMGDDAPWIVEAGKETYDWRCLAIVPCDGDEVPRREAEANMRLFAASRTLVPDLIRIAEEVIAERDEARRQRDEALRTLEEAHQRGLIP